MFKSLKIKIQSMFDQRRSASICIESKTKEINSKLEHSFKKINQNSPEEENDVCSTPNRHFLIGNLSDHFDNVETVSREITSSNFNLTNNASNINKFTSIDSVSSKNESCFNKSFLPEEPKTIPMKNDSKSCVVWDENLDSPEEIILHEFSLPILEDFKDFQTNQSKEENSLINKLIEIPIEEKEEAKVSKESIKREKAILIREERIEAYKKAKQKELKGKSKFSCIICQEKSCSADSFNLACTHRIHKLCAEISRWRPKMKCLLCERRNVKNEVFRFNHGELMRKVNESQFQKGFF